MTRYILDQQAKRPDQFFVVRYEDLKKDAVQAIRPMFEFLGVDTSQEVMGDILAATDFQKLKGKEKGGFFRKGTSGDWKNYFTDKDKAQFKKNTGDLLVELGYENDNRW